MSIRIPSIVNFRSIYSYIHTIAHETAHSTGMFLGRFEKDSVSDVKEAMQSYSKEELIAEISAEILCSELHIPDDEETPDNAVAYIHSWSSYLKDRPSEIISASAKAEKVCELILECLRELEKEQVNEYISQEECR